MRSLGTDKQVCCDFMSLSSYLLPLVNISDPIEVEIQMPDEVLRDPNYQRLSDDDCMFMQSSTLRSKHRWPFHIFVYPLVRSGAAGALSKDLPLAQAVRMLPPEDVARWDWWDLKLF